MELKRITFGVVSLALSCASVAQVVPVPGSSTCEPYPAKGAVE